MRTIISATACLVIASSAPALGQKVQVSMELQRDHELALALSAAPAEVAAKAGVYVYAKLGYVRVRDSQNGFTCLVNRDSELEGYHVLKPTCWDAHGSETIVPAILEIARLRGRGVATEQVVREIRDMIKTGQLKPFSQQGIAYMLAGDIAGYDTAAGGVTKRVFPPHVMLYLPAGQNVQSGMSMEAAMTDARTPLTYESATGYRYLVIRVP